ncbi:MAG: hypothetical protein R6X25_04890 [Candidatus Krumholzibacteriia bacterium]
MSARTGTILSDPSIAAIKRLEAFKEKIEDLEFRKAELERQLASVDQELERLFTAAGKLGTGKKTAAAGEAAAPARKKAVRKKRTTGKAAKKTARKAAKKTGKRTAKKTAKAAKKTAKKTAKRPAKKKAAARGRGAGKKVGRKAGKKAARPAPAAAARRGRDGQPRLEDVVADLIRRHGGTMPYQEILGAILEGGLYQTRARNFDNVLRRTLSTSENIKRVGRGVYSVD